MNLKFSKAWEEYHHFGINGKKLSFSEVGFHQYSNVQFELAEFTLTLFLNTIISISGKKCVKKSDKREPTVYYAAKLEYSQIRLNEK